MYVFFKKEFYPPKSHNFKIESITELLPQVSAMRLKHAFSQRSQKFLSLGGIVREKTTIKEVTPKQIDAYLDTLALLMTRHSPEFDWLMPLYQRLENDKVAMLEETDKFHQIYQRAQRCQNKKSS